MPESQPPPVSGRYSYLPGADREQPGASASAALKVVVRVDVDGPQSLEHISVEVSRRFPPVMAHGIARVTADRIGSGQRILEASLGYMDGDPNLLPGRHLVFEASGLRQPGDPVFTLAFGDRPGLGSYPLRFESSGFDDVELEVDQVENAGEPVVEYATGAHPVRPPDLPDELLTLAGVYREAGFNAAMSRQTSVIPIVEAGADGAWSDDELHNAMVTYWSRFAHRPQWALWVLYANRHEQGKHLGGVMFDDIGDHHRQGTAIFTRSFISDAPPDDPAPKAWQQRMQFWTAIHETGHAFNLAHSWQKSLSTPLGDPWVPLANQPEARSFMNYPFNVQGGERAFFGDFRFRFNRDELLFMRHAPRRFVQMGHSDWFENHGLWPLRQEHPEGPADWHLQLRPNREVNAYAFMEPVILESKLTNRSGQTVTVDENLLAFEGNLKLVVQREGNVARPWRAMVTRCSQYVPVSLAPGESVYGAHNASVSPSGWLIDTPGFYKVQAGVEIAGQVVMSNVLRLYVAQPQQPEEDRLAVDYFSEDVARALVFNGVPALPKAMSVLRSVADRCPLNPAALHAAVAVSAPDLMDYKLLDTDDGSRLRLRCHRARIADAAPVQNRALLRTGTRAVDTFGHIAYFRALDRLAEALSQHGDQPGARRVLTASLHTMQQRAILEAVIRRTRSRIARLA